MRSSSLNTILSKCNLTLLNTTSINDFTHERTFTHVYSLHLYVVCIAGQIMTTTNIQAKNPAIPVTHIWQVNSCVTGVRCPLKQPRKWRISVINWNTSVAFTLDTGWYVWPQLLMLYTLAADLCLEKLKFETIFSNFKWLSPEPLNQI